MCFTSSGTRSGEFEGGEGDCRRRRWTPSTLRRYGSRCNNRNLGNATYWFRCSLRGIQSPRAAPTHNHAVGKDANTSLASCPAHASRSYHGHTHQLVDCEANCSTPRGYIFDVGDSIYSVGYTRQFWDGTIQGRLAHCVRSGVSGLGTVLLCARAPDVSRNRFGKHVGRPHGRVHEP